MSGRGDGGSGTTFRSAISMARSRAKAACAAPLASAARSVRLTVRCTPARSWIMAAAPANGPAAAALPVITASPGDRDVPAVPSSASRGARPCPQAWQWYQARCSVTGPRTVSMTLSRQETRTAWWPLPHGTREPR
jgi:hypothetical protein